jgi:hypothetical protein
MFRRYPRGIITANSLTGTSGVYSMSERLQSASGAVSVTDLGNSANSPSAISPRITLTNAVPAGSLIFIFGSFAGNTGAVGTLTLASSVSQTWNSQTITVFPGIVGQEAKMFASYSYNSAAMAAGATITAEMGGGGKTSGVITACVITGVLSTASVYDASVFNYATGDSSSGSATISGTSSTQANEVIIYGFVSNAYFGGATTFTQASGYALPPSSTNTGGSGAIIGGGHKITTASGQAASVTNTTNGSNPWGLMVYGFKTT